MVAPIVGPVTTTVGGSGADPAYYSRQLKWKQAMPIDRPLRYQRDVGKATWYGSPPKRARSVGTTLHGTAAYDFTFLNNKAYDSLKNKMADRAQLSVSLIEGRQSIAMIASRAGQLFQFGRRLSRLDLAGAAKALKLSAVPKGASIKKSFASNWLEYYFGWLPLIGDIGSAVDVLQSPLKNQFVKGGAKSSIPTVFLQPYTVYENPSAVNNVCYRLSYEKVTVDIMGASQGCSVAVSNPNLWLANQLGFVNPATVAWELIPFSFVVDWFVNVEQFLSSGTDFLGLTLEDAWNVQYVSQTYEYRLFEQWRRWTGVGLNYYITTERNDFCTAKGYHTTRGLDLVSPILQVRPLKMWKWKRALTAVSLLTQQLSRR